MDQTTQPVSSEPTVITDFVFGLFPTSASLDAAIKKLETSGFDRADLSLPEIDPPPDRDTPELSAEPADTDTDAQQARVVQSTTGGAFAAMIAATAAAAATGGAMVAVAGAAVGAGLVVGAAVNAISNYTSSEEQLERDRRAAAGRLVMSVRAPDVERHMRAIDILRATGATRVW